MRRLALAAAILWIPLSCASGSVAPPAATPTDRLPIAPMVTEALRYHNDARGISFTYRAPWFIEAQDPGSVSLVNYTLSEEELDRRAEAGAYGAHDGEGFFSLRFTKRADFARARRSECREGGTTLEVHECKVITIDGRNALWVLAEHSNDGNCTCRYMVINGPRRGYRLIGGGCIDCAGTPAILRDVERMMRSVEIS